MKTRFTRGILVALLSLTLTVTMMPTGVFAAIAAAMIKAEQPRR